MGKEEVATFRPIGEVESAVRNKSEMPIGGVHAYIHIRPEFAEALDGIEGFSRLWVICFLHLADRSVLRAAPRKLSGILPERGVFALRSPVRPNPISITVARLMKREGLVLDVEEMDATDGTPVLDIKPYYSGMDAFLGMGSPYGDAKFASITDAMALDMLLRTVEHYVGRASVGAMLGLAAMFAYVGRRRRDPSSAIRRVRTNLSGDALDAVYAVVQATPGSGRIVCIEQAEDAYVDITDDAGTWRVTVTKDGAEAIMRDPSAWQTLPWKLVDPNPA